jgi:hypothetical protein
VNLFLRISERISSILWIVVLVGLPLTSFPAFVVLTNAIVTPFSALPIALIIVIWLIPTLIRGGSMPVEIFLILVFLMFTVISSAHAFFIEIPTFKEATLLRQESRALITLIIGLSFYFIFAAFPRDSHSIHKSLQLIHIGGLLLVLVTLPQVYYILIKAPQYPKWIYILTDLLTERTPYFFGVNRVSGLAYEPSWFSHQMILFYIPLWLAATIQRTSSFRFRIFHLSFENILLVFGGLEFFMSAPRISLIGVLLIAIFLAIRVHKWITTHLFENVNKSRLVLSSGSRKRTARVVINSLLICAYLVVGFGLFLFILKNDPRMTNFFLYPPSLKEIKEALSLNEVSLLLIANRMAFFERATYWFTGLRIFNLHPILGVGLGNAGFFFKEQIPWIGWTSYEILELLNELFSLPNIKSLWIRLLAETGLVGFSVFSLWLFNLWRSSRLFASTQDSSLKVIAVAGQLSLLALIGEGFSVDSFAMPYLWSIAGLISACAFIYRQQLRLKAMPEQSVQQPDHPRRD